MYNRVPFVASLPVTQRGRAHDDDGEPADLTPEQRAIVGPATALVVIAGRHGKTRVIVERVRWLLRPRRDRPIDRWPRPGQPTPRHGAPFGSPLVRSRSSSWPTT
jgi:hypothetical protein